jgi:hypothetical protein
MADRYPRVVLRKVWPPSTPVLCTVTGDGKHWPFPHYNGGTYCATCGQPLASERSADA